MRALTQSRILVNRRRLEVLVKGGSGLKSCDFGGKACPFAELIIKDRGTVKKTSEKMDTLSPEWNEAFEFEVVDEVDDMLDISVYGHKKVERNVLLGVLTIPVALVESSPEPITRAFPLHELHDVHKPTQGEVTLTLTWTDSEGVKHVHSGVPRQGEHERVHAAREAETRREFVEHQEEYERDRPEMRERREREEREGRAYEHRWSKRR